MKTPNTIKAISLIVLGMLAFFATTNVTWGFDSMDSSNSREVLQRLSLTKETQDNIDSIFNTYADRIAECNRADKAALEKRVRALLGTDADVRQAKQDEQDASKKWADAIHERDAAIRKALPTELTGKFDRGMELVTKRNEKYLKAYEDELTREKRRIQMPNLDQTPRTSKRSSKTSQINTTNSLMRRSAR